MVVPGDEIVIRGLLGSAESVETCSILPELRDEPHCQHLLFISLALSAAVTVSFASVRLMVFCLIFCKMCAFLFLLMMRFFFAPYVAFRTGCVCRRSCIWWGIAKPQLRHLHYSYPEWENSQVKSG